MKPSLWFIVVAAIATMTAAAQAGTTPSAVINDVYQSHEEINTFSCADESKCDADTTDHFTTATTVRAGDVVRASYHLQHTQVFSEAYGVTGFSWAGFLNTKTNKGNLIHTQYGPKARPFKSYDVPKDIDWLDPSQMAGGPDRMKGTHANSGWHDEERGIMETVKHTADAKTELTVTGDPGKIYNVRLHASAAEWHLGTVLTAVGVQFIDKPIPCIAILLRGVPLNADCEVSLNFAPGTYDVTPSAPGRYIYSVGAADVIWSHESRSVSQDAADKLRNRIRELLQQLKAPKLESLKKTLQELAVP